MQPSRNPWILISRLPACIDPAIGILALLLAAGSSSAFPTAAEPPAEWSNWRGPDSQGVALGTSLPDPWPAQAVEPVWTASLGTGWSSPVIEKGIVFVTDRIDAKERVLAFDARSGKPLWTRENPIDFDPHAVGRRHGNGPKATPVVRDGRVYSLGIAGWLQCLTSDSGHVIWSKNLPKEFGQPQPLRDGRTVVVGTQHVLTPIGRGQGAPVPLFGYTGSPVLDSDLLVLSVGGARGGTIVAFDAATGDPAWKALDENVSYSSPVVADLAGIRQVVAMTGPRVVGLDLRDGRLLWDHPFQIDYDESIVTPLVADDLVLVSAFSRPLTALAIAAEAGGIRKTVAWQNRDLSAYMSSMVVHAGHVYGMNDGGEFACIRLSDGQTQWLGGEHGTYASPVLAGERLFALNERGAVLVLAANPQAYRELGQSQLADAATWTVPALSGGRIFVRSDGRLACFVLGEEPADAR